MVMISMEKLMIFLETNQLKRIITEWIKKKTLNKNHKKAM